MSDISTTPTSAARGIRVDVPMPEFWTANEVSEATRGETERELVDMLAGKVEEPEALATEAYDEFMQRVGGGAQPLLIASFNEELDGGSRITASLMVNRNELTGSLDSWRNAYDGDALELEVSDRPALRTEESTIIPAGALFEDELTVATYRYIVEFDRRSTLVFNFTTPNAELKEIFAEHFDEIMARVTIDPSGSDDADDGESADTETPDATEAED